MKQLRIWIPPKPKFDSTIEDILQSPEYSHLKNGIGNFIESIKKSIFDWLERMFNKINLDKAAGVSEGLSTVFMILGLIVFISIVIAIVVMVTKSFDKKTRLKEILGEKIDEKTTPMSLRSTAEGFGKKEEYRLAIRYDFIALLLLMHENGLLYLDETKTNLEIYTYLKKNHFSKLTDFGYLIEAFNSTWYGQKYYDSDGYKIWSEKLNLIWNEAWTQL